MDEKSISIMQAAIKLFAKKGFTSTSVQEIAKNAGISKGAFYLHFSSKDELLFALFDYYYNQMKAKVDACVNEPDPREKFVSQLAVMFKEIASHRDFIKMQIREQTIPFNEDIETFTSRMRYESYQFYQNHILDIYGKNAEEFSFEISIISEGMYKAYLELILMEGARFDFRNLAETLLRRVDYLVEGFLYHQDTPLLTKAYMADLIPEEFLGVSESALHKLIQAEETKAGGEEKEALTILKEELTSSSPRTAIIKGMTAVLREDGRFEEIIDRVEETYPEIRSR
ncbi:TetR/AcrR family transcriptional regulator [Salimicrobium salexigens]|uniref:Transcriptional regulator, TetR family n=1 Tax=Salimicrobium salexigens TaxID=908941 RepID=A0ABY1KWR5_9BACI|nr:TetR/AcrR family transcriptional regulator [Salimicrobium salexigens]SIS80798.1 transcriptional regulator, TetR family [Salimicrobium salexigens]